MTVMPSARVLTDAAFLSDRKVQQLRSADFRHIIARGCRTVAIVTLIATATSCSNASDNPTAPSGQLGFSATAGIISSNRRGGILEVELLLDGLRVASRSFQSAETGLVILQTDDMFISPGAHRLSVRVVRQAASPTSWDVQIGAAVLNFSTIATQEFKLPNDIQTVSLTDGQMTTLQFTVKP